MFDLEKNQQTTKKQEKIPRGKDLKIILEFHLKKRL